MIEACSSSPNGQLDSSTWFLMELVECLFEQAACVGVQHHDLLTTN